MNISRIPHSIHVWLSIFHILFLLASQFLLELQETSYYWLRPRLFFSVQHAIFFNGIEERHDNSFTLLAVTWSQH